MELNRDRKVKFLHDLMTALDTMESIDGTVEKFPEGRELLIYTLELVKRDLNG